MGITPHILLKSRRLASYLDLINTELGKSLRRIEKFVTLPNLDLVIYDNPKGSIPEIGIGGFTPNAHTILVSTNPEFKDFEKAIKGQLGRTVTHELHHALRWSGPGYGKTLFEALVTEGLADHFDLEVNGPPPQPWTAALTENELIRVGELAETEYDKKRYSHGDWFFGSKKRNIPRWSGYTLGFKIVSDYLKKNPAAKPSKLYNTSAKDFKE